MASRVVAKISTKDEPLIKPENAKRLCSDIRARIVHGFLTKGYHRDPPGGLLATNAMWDISVTKNSSSETHLRIKAALDSTGEYAPPYKRQDEEHRYAWDVEFGHSVHQPRFGKRIPFLRQGGKIWRVVMAQTSSRVYKHTWKYTGNNRKGIQYITETGVIVTKQQQALGKTRSANRKSQNDANHFYASDIIWCRVGKQTKYVQGAHVVRDVLSKLGGSRYRVDKGVRIAKTEVRFLKNGQKRVTYKCNKHPRISLIYRPR